jgi:hypothetical protein
MFIADPSCHAMSCRSRVLHFSDYGKIEVIGYGIKKPRVHTCRMEVVPRSLVVVQTSSCFLQAQQPQARAALFPPGHL